MTSACWSPAGLTRGSIFFAKAKVHFPEKMDCRVKRGNDGPAHISISSATSSCGAEWVIQPEEM